MAGEVLTVVHVVPSFEYSMDSAEDEGLFIEIVPAVMASKVSGVLSISCARVFVVIATTANSRSIIFFMS